MAFIKNVSDKAEKCPNDETSFFKKKVTWKIMLIVIALICVGIFVLISPALFPKFEVDNAEIEKWKLTRTIDAIYSGYYEATIVSEQKKPFIVTINNYFGTIIFHHCAYIENGEGTLELSAFLDEDPSLIYKITGYLSGDNLEEKDLNYIKYYSDNYEDSELTNETSCYITVNVEMKNKSSGLFFYEYNCELNNKKALLYTAVYNGNAEDTIFLFDLPYKSRETEITVTPKYFCKCVPLTENGCTIEKNLSFETETSSDRKIYNGEMKLHIDNCERGILIYTEQLKNGGNTEKLGKIRVCTAEILDNRCDITTYDSGENINKPEYDIKIIGYVPINEIAENE